MDVDDFQDLYNLLRGSRSAAAVLDARALFSEKKMADAHRKLSEARETFAESRARVLKQDPEKQIDRKAKDRDRQIKKAKRKQEKARETLEAFDETLQELNKQVDRQQLREARAAEKAAALALAKRSSAKPAPSKPNPPNPPNPSHDSDRIELDSDSEFDSDDTDVGSGDETSDSYRVAKPIDASASFIRAYADCDGDDRLDVISQSFGFHEVQSESDIHGEAIYFIQTSKRSLLVRTPAIDEMSEQVALTNLVDDRAIKPFDRQAFLKLGKRRKMVLLTCPEDTESSGKAESSEQPVEEAGGESQAAESQSPSSAGNAPTQSVLDMGAFSQLLSAAQRSGLVPGADQIGHARDREFRMGNYDLAFQAIDSMYSRFTAASSQRLQRLKREDVDISTGRLKLSPKDLQAKRSRDRSQTQEVDRANRRFQVVLEGLRVLLNNR